MSRTDERRELLEQLLPIARMAGDAIMNVYDGTPTVVTKADASPVTNADDAAERVILEALPAIDPEIPIVSEEAFAAGERRAVGERFWLVDPLDGTKEFISRNGEFTVNIALVEDGKPVLGAVFAPAVGELYAGGQGIGSFVEKAGERRKIRCRRSPAEGLTVVSSRSHGDQQGLERFLAGKLVSRTTTAGSSLKLCRVAAGEADCYPRLGRTMEWDIAAGHAILAAAGGRVTHLDGTELTYGKPGFENPHFVAWGALGHRNQAAMYRSL
jgi:3'(2'), 5'-bisphosphate nucleotidase